MPQVLGFYDEGLLLQWMQRTRISSRSARFTQLDACVGLPSSEDEQLRAPAE